MTSLPSGSSGRLAGRFIRRQLEPGARLDTVGHLTELRTRLAISVGVFAIGFTAAFIERHRILNWLNEPLNGAEPVTLGVAEPFMTSIKVSMFAAFALTLPVLFFQIWSFVAPSFGHHIRRSVAWYAFSGSLLFVTGIAFGYFIALPSAVDFLTAFDSGQYDVQIRAQEYYTFTAAVLLSIGLVFQLPVVLLGLVRFEILTYEKLRANRRIAYVGLTGLAVLMPGVDPVTTAMWILPLGILYELSIVLAKRQERRTAKRVAAAAD